MNGSYTAVIKQSGDWWIGGLDGLKKSPELIVRHPQRVSYLKV